MLACSDGRRHLWTGMCAKMVMSVQVLINAYNIYNVGLCDSVIPFNISVFSIDSDLCDLSVHT